MFDAAFIGISLITVIGVYLIIRRGFRPRMRRLNAADSFTTFIGQAIEKGGRVHLFTSANNLGTEKAITSLAAISLLDPALRNMPLTDQPPLTSSADPATALAMMDKLELIYRRKGVFDERKRLPSQQLSLDPISAAAAVTSVTQFNNIDASILYGSMGIDAAIAAETGRRKGIPQIIASDQIEGQAASQTLCDFPLIGEEVFQTPTILKGDTTAVSALVAADIMRWVIVVAILVGIILISLGVIGG